MAGTYTMTIVGEDKASAVLGKIGTKAQETSGKVDKLGTSGGGLKGLAGGLGGVLGAIGGAGIIAGIGDSTKAFVDLGTAVKGIQRVAGGSIEDASRLRTEFAMSGVSAEGGANAIKKLEVGLATAGKTTKATTAMTQALGFSFTDAHGAVLPMSDLMPQLADKFKSMPDGAAKTALAVKLFGKSGTEMIPMLNKGAAGLKDMAAKSDQLGLTLNGGSMAAITKSKANTRDMSTAMQGLKVSIGQYVLPVITTLTTFLVSHVIPAFTAVMKWIKDNPTLVKILATAIGGLVIAFKAMQIISTITKALEAFKIAQGATTVAQGLLNAVMAINPFVLIGIAIVALVAVFVILWKKSEAFRDFFKAIWSAIKTATTAVLTALKVAMQAAWTAIKKAIDVVWAAIKTATDVAWKLIKTLILTPITAVFNWFKSVFSTLGRVLSDLWGGIKSAASGAWNTVKSYVLTPIQAAYNWIKNTFGTISGWFSGLWTGIKNTASSVWTGITNMVTAPLQAAWTWVQTTFGKITGFISGLWTTIISDASSILGGIGTAVGTAFGVITDIIKTPINGVIHSINWVIDQIDKISVTLPAFLGGYHIGFDIGHIPELAKGGPMAPGSLAWVGELGPELFRAGSAGGTIIPQKALSAGTSGQVVNHITLNMAGATIGTADQVARSFADLISKAQQRGVVKHGAFA